jgi:hypothetical protein
LDKRGGCIQHPAQSGQVAGVDGIGGGFEPRVDLVVPVSERVRQVAVPMILGDRQACRVDIQRSAQIGSAKRSTAVASGTARLTASRSNSAWRAIQRSTGTFGTSSRGVSQPGTGIRPKVPLTIGA